MLDAVRLRGNLREFCDPEYPPFRGSPTTREQARRAWAAAFDDYIDEVQEAITPPVVGHPMMDLGGVEGAFFADLGLVPSSSAEVAAADFAGAWRAGILAVVAGGTVTDGASNTYAFVRFTNVGPLHDGLRATLAALFRSPSASTVVRLGEIADAFHAATRALLVEVTITSSGGGTTTGTIGVL